MTDAPKLLSETGDDSFVSALIERLTKRATEPIGVIDVRHAEEKYFRIVRWLARRNALLDRLKKQYGVEPATASGERTLAIQRRVGEQVNVFSPTVQYFSSGLSFDSLSRSSDAPQRQTLAGIRPSGLADILAERSSTRAVEPPLSSETTFRVSRRPPPMLPDTEASQSSSSARTGPAGEQSAPEQSTRDASASVMSTTDQMGGLVYRDGVVENSIERKAEASTGSRAPASPAFTDERVDTALSNAQQEASTTTSAQEQRARAAVKTEPVDIASSSEQSQVRKVANASTLRSLPLVLSHAKGDEHLYGRPSVAAPLPEAKDLAPERGGHGGPPVQAHQNRGGSQEPDIESTVAVALAVPVESFNPEKPEMVWRTPQAEARAAGSTTQKPRFLSTSSGGIQSGQIESGSIASASVELGGPTLQGGHSALPTSAQTQSNEIQAEHISPQAIRSISERVIRAITLDLRLERERRGVTKWR